MNDGATDPDGRFYCGSMAYDVTPAPALTNRRPFVTVGEHYGLNQLYLTTSRENLPDHEQPEAGSVFRARPGGAGLPPAPFAG